MCGIAYLEVPNNCNPNIHKEFSVQAKRYLSRRGPNGNNTMEIVNQNSNAILVHYRLSVQDLNKRSDQPMSSDDGLISIIYNGEIYNFVELRSDLQRRFGAIFKTKSDTEVLLRGYELLGIDFLKSVDGMFAFVIHDQRFGITLAGRDHAGMKPLYYSSIDDKLIISSDIRIISKIFKPTFSDKGLAQYFSLGYCLSPHTIFNNIYQINPGEVISFQDTKITGTQKVFDLLDEFSNERRNENFTTYCTNSHNEICQTMSQHVRSDVPVGIMASGGIDTRLMGLGLLDSDGHKKIDHSWTINKSGSEWEIIAAKSLSEKLKSEHYVVNEPDTSESLDDAIKCLTHPCVDMAILFTWLLGQQAKKKQCPVLLSGVGGDELFFGYNRYQSKLRQISFSQLNILGSLSKVSRSLDSLRLLSPSFGLATSVLGSFDIVESLFGSKRAHDIVAEDFLAIDRSLNSIDGFVHRMLAVDLITYVPNQLCMISDSALMDHSIEGRLPLLSKAMIKNTARTHPSFIYKEGILKGGLQELLHKFNLMEDYKGKSGFGDNKLSNSEVQKKEKLINQLSEQDIQVGDFSARQLNSFSYLDLLKLQFLTIWLES